MKEYGLLLQRHAGGEPHRHDGQIAVAERNRRWCSDGFQIGCDNGEQVRVAFTLDCCDREAISFVPTTGGIGGLEPRTTPQESPRSNGMAEAFVGTFKRDYARVNAVPDATTDVTVGVVVSICRPMKVVNAPDRSAALPAWSLTVAPLGRSTCVIARAKTGWSLGPTV